MDKPPPPGFVPPPPYSAHSMPQSMPQYTPQYTPQQQAPPVVVIQSQQAFGPESQPMTCPHCMAQISTRVETDSTSKTHLFALLLCLIGFWVCVPCVYCMDSCLSKKHYCPNCNSFLGEYDN